jgi:hypothetical protein
VAVSVVVVVVDESRRSVVSPGTVSALSAGPSARFPPLQAAATAMIIAAMRRRVS